MPRTYTASQRAPRATQASQPSQPSQSQGRAKRGSQRRRRVEEEEEEEEEQPDPADENEDIDMDEERRGHGDDDLMRKANDLVRLALFTENKRTPLRRDDITKKVLGTQTRSFNTVFMLAQQILQRTFGMELAEMRSRAELERDFAGAKAGDTGAATGLKKKATTTGSRTYVLRSTLSPLIVEIAAQTDAAILEEESADVPSEAEDSDDDALYKNYGSIIAWNKSDQLGAIGVLYVVLALILVNGRAIGNNELRTMLKRLHLSSSDFIMLSPSSTHQKVSTDDYLSQLMRQGYIDRYNTGEAAGGTGTSKKGKRGRPSAADGSNANDGGGAADTYEWRWGNRAEVEVGEKAIARFVAEFMVSEQLKEERRRDGDDDDDDGETREARRKKKAELEKRMEKMMGSIQTVAGGTLVDARDT